MNHMPLAQKSRGFIMDNFSFEWNDDVDNVENFKSAISTLFLRMDLLESKLDDTLDCLLDNLDRDKLAASKAKEFYNDDNVKDMLSSFTSSFEGGGASGVLDLVSSLQDLKGKLSTLGDNLSGEQEDLSAMSSEEVLDNDSNQ